MALLSQAFFDESGNPKSEKFIIGGYVGHSEMWKHFSDDWEAVLRGDEDGLPAWPKTFHSVEAENGKKGFGVLGYEERLRRVALLVEVIARHRPHCVVAIIDNGSFARDLEKALSVFDIKKKGEHWAHPYSFGAIGMCGAMFDFQDAVNRRQERDLGTTEIVFDHMDKIGKAMQVEAKIAVVDWVRESQPSGIHARIGYPRWIERGEKERYTPLQAADLLMWHYGRKYNQGENRSALRCLKIASPPHFLKGREGEQFRWIALHAAQSYKSKLRRQFKKALRAKRRKS